MGYKKFTVDNTTCSRRFHLSFDDEAEPMEKVQISCPHCGVKVFEAQNHPAVAFARDENLVKTTALSELTFDECKFKDKLSEKTIPASKRESSGPIYK